MTYSVALPKLSIFERRGNETLRRAVSDFFEPDKRTLLVTLPGPWLSNRAAAYYDKHSLGFDATVLCCTNDSFVMNAWASELNLRRVDLLPDGNGQFCTYLGLLITSPNRGSYAYSSEWSVHNNRLEYLGDIRCK